MVVVVEQEEEIEEVVVHRASSFISKAIVSSLVISKVIF